MNDKARAAETARRIANSGITFGVVLGVYTLVVSREHITHVGQAIGLNRFEANTLFLLIDFVAVFGKVLINRNLSAKTRRIGRQGLMAGLGLSLVCNVVSGLIKGGIIPAELSFNGLGQAGYGAFIVVMLVWIEHAVSNCKPKATIERKPNAVKAPAPPTTTTAAPASTSKRCTTGCTCRRHPANRGGSNGRTPQPPPAAPVSPGHGPANGILVPDLATVRQVAGVR